jgi:hypothetical protein
MRFIRTLYTAALMVPSLSLAQGTAGRSWPVSAGSRVRVLSPIFGDRAQTGSVISATSDTLVFMPAKTSSSTAISTPNIVRLDVSTGTHSNKLKGALLGFVLGAGVGAAIGTATYKPCSNCFDILGRGGAIAAGSVVGGLAGLAGGMIIGSRPSDNWVSVPIPVR